MNSAMADVQRKSDECVAKAGPALLKLADIAAKVKLPNQERQLLEIRISLANDKFSVAVVGRFRNGKSTVMNALLGRLTKPCAELPRGGAPLPTSVNPTTARTARVYYADSPTVHAVSLDGHKNPWTFDRYLEEGKQRSSPEATEQAFKDIAEFELGFPTELCRDGVVLIDTPGRSDTPELDRLAKQTVLSSDATVVLLRHSATLGKDEREFIEELQAEGVDRFFILINTFDRLSPETPAFVWNKIMNEFFGGPLYNGQDLESEDIYFVNALDAENGKLAGDYEAVKRSGLDQFETRLAKYLESERRYVHLQTFLQRAEAQTAQIADAISKEIPALQVEQAAFEEKYKAAIPKREAIRARALRIPKIIAMHRDRAAAAIQNGLTDFYEQIALELPAAMASKKLPSMKSAHWWDKLKNAATAPFHRDRLGSEAMDLATGIIKERLNTWQRNPPEKPGAARILNPILLGMLDELKDEAKAIEKGYGDIHFELSGWTPPQTKTGVQEPGLVNRVTAVAFSALTGNFDTAILAAGGGWKAVGVDLLRMVIIAVPAAFLVPAAFIPIAGPIIAAAAFVWTAITSADKIERGIKEATIKVLLDGHPGDPAKNVPPFRGLLHEPRRLQKEIADSVAKVFVGVEKAVMKEIDREIEKEEGLLNQEQLNNSKSAEEKAFKIRELRGYQATIAACSADLKQVLTSAAQVKSKPNPVGAAAF